MRDPGPRVAAHETAAERAPEGASETRVTFESVGSLGRARGCESEQVERDAALDQELVQLAAEFSKLSTQRALVHAKLHERARSEERSVTMAPSARAPRARSLGPVVQRPVST